jgi:hypothetical protein
VSAAHDWTHDGLMRDLAGYLRGPDTLVWEDMQLGPSGSPRPDVFTLRKSYSKPLPTAFECKVSRSDLRSDTTSGKWQSYLKFAGSVTFAVPDGLCTVADIPDGCGLIVRKAEVWRYARRPTVQHVTPPFSACMKLLIDGVNRVSQPSEPRPRTAKLWEEHAAVRKKFGAAVAKAARDLASAQKDAAERQEHERYLYQQAQQRAEAHGRYLTEQARKNAGEYEQVKAEICEWLGLGLDTSIFNVRRRLTEMRAECNADLRVQAVEAKLAAARRSVEAATHVLAETVSAAA